MLLRILTIKFNTEIKQSEIPLFRGAVIDITKGENILLHNHIGASKFRYSYPLVQYKIINRKAAIICLGDGVDAIGEFFSSLNHNIHLGDREVSLSVEDISAKKTAIIETDPMIGYRISSWLPLNQKNYKEYKTLDSLAEKCIFLENILRGNILSFCKGIGYHLDFNLKSSITQIKESGHIRFKNIKMQSFNAEFKANINLPSRIGLGKGTSLGFGNIFIKRIPEDLYSVEQP